MRVLRLLGVVGLGIAVLGALGAGLLTAWAVSGGQAAPRPAAARTDPPAGLGGDVPPRLEARIEPFGPDTLDQRLTVRNPNARAVPGVRVVVEVEGATCQWDDGRFPSPLGLAPAESTSRTCRLEPEPGARTPTIGMTVHVGSRQVASASTVIDPPVPTTSTLDPGPAVEGSPRIGGTSPGSGPAGSPPTGVGATPPATAPPSCPRLVDGVELAAAPALAAVGPAITDRARLLDTSGCPDWAAVTGLRVVRTDEPELCPPWDLRLDGMDVVGRLRAPQVPGCPAAPLEVEVLDQPLEVSARLAALTAWALEGSSARAAALHRAAATGTGLTCAGTATGGGSVSLGHAYEQRVDGQVVYRVTVRAC